MEFPVKHFNELLRCSSAASEHFGGLNQIYAVLFL